MFEFLEEISEIEVIRINKYLDEFCFNWNKAAGRNISRHDIFEVVSAVHVCTYEPSVVLSDYDKPLVCAAVMGEFFRLQLGFKWASIFGRPVVVNSQFKLIIDPCAEVIRKFDSIYYHGISYHICCFLSDGYFFNEHYFFHDLASNLDSPEVFFRNWGFELDANFEKLLLACLSTDYFKTIYRLWPIGFKGKFFDQSQAINVLKSLN